jgi:cobalt-zinc-cadmium efflux system outer membrane protein
MTSTLLLTLCLATLDAQAPHYTLGDLEQRALAAHPALAVAQAESQAIKQAAEQAGALPNPVVGYQGEDIRAGAPTYGGQHGVFMEQVIPLGGKLHVRRDALLQQGRASEAAIDVARQRVRAGVRAAYARALVAVERVRVGESLEATLDESVQTSRQLYNIGMADRPDLLEVEAESARAALGARTARADREAAWTALAASVGDPALPRGELEGAIADLPQLADRATAWQTTEQESPQLAEAARLADVADAGIAVERGVTSPDLLLRGGAMYDRARETGDAHANGWQGRAEVGVNLPLWNRNHAGIAASQAQSEAARSRARAVSLDLRRRFDETYASYSTSADAVRTYRDEILPRADQAYKLTLERYRAMSASYVQVLIARRTLVDATAAYVDALGQAWREAVALQTGLAGKVRPPPTRPFRL